MSVQQLRGHRLRRHLSAEEWGIVFEDWCLSGLSKSIYCREKQLTLSCFERWYKRLHILKSSLVADTLLPGSVDSSCSRLPDSPSSSKLDSLRSSFIPVSVGGISPTISDGSERLKLEIVLSGGHHVCVAGVVWEQVQVFLRDSMRC